MSHYADLVRVATQEYGYRYSETINGVRIFIHPHRSEPLLIRGKDTDKVGPVTYRGIMALLNRE